MVSTSLGVFTANVAKGMWLKMVLPLFLLCENITEMPTQAMYHFSTLNYRALQSSHHTFSVVIQGVSLDEPASSAAARSQTFIVLHRDDGTDHNHY